MKSFKQFIKENSYKSLQQNYKQNRAMESHGDIQLKEGWLDTIRQKLVDIGLVDPKTVGLDKPKPKPKTQTVNTLGKSDSMQPIAKTNTVSPPAMQKPTAADALRALGHIAKTAADVYPSKDKATTYTSDYGKQSKSLQDLVNKALASKGKTRNAV